LRIIGTTGCKAIMYCGSKLRILEVLASVIKTVTTARSSADSQ